MASSANFSSFPHDAGSQQRRNMLKITLQSSHKNVHFKRKKDLLERSTKNHQAFVVAVDYFGKYQNEEP